MSITRSVESAHNSLRISILVSGGGVVGWLAGWPMHTLCNQIKHDPKSDPTIRYVNVTSSSFEDRAGT